MITTALHAVVPPMSSKGTRPKGAREPTGGTKRFSETGHAPIHVYNQAIGAGSKARAFLVIAVLWPPQGLFQRAVLYAINNLAVFQRPLLQEEKNASEGRLLERQNDRILTDERWELAWRYGARDARRLA